MSAVVSRRLLTTLAVAAVVGVVRAQYHLIRLGLLAALGLAGMYMLHVLAQDYNKIRQPVKPKLAAAVLRSLIAKRSLPDLPELDESLNEVADWDRILEADPAGCARRVVCELAARPDKALHADEKHILAFVRQSGGGGDAAAAFAWAASLGQEERDPAACAAVFRKCPFSSEFVLKTVRGAVASGGATEHYHHDHHELHTRPK